MKTGRLTPNFGTPRADSLPTSTAVVSAPVAMSFSSSTTWPSTFDANMSVTPSLVLATGVGPPEPPAFRTTARTGVSMRSIADLTESGSLTSIRTVVKTDLPVSAPGRHAPPALSRRYDRRGRWCLNASRSASWRATSLPAYPGVRAGDEVPPRPASQPSSISLRSAAVCANVCALGLAKRRQLHAPDPKVASDIRYRTEEHSQHGQQDQGHDDDCYPTHYFHVGFLSLVILRQLQATAVLRLQRHIGRAPSSLRQVRWWRTVTRWTHG